MIYVLMAFTVGTIAAWILTRFHRPDAELAALIGGLWPGFVVGFVAMALSLLPGYPLYLCLKTMLSPMDKT